MSAILPLLLANQTLYSWCSHAHQLNCSTSAHQTSDQLFGTPYSALCHDFPAHLRTLTQRTRGQLGSPRELALRHTLLGYFLPTIDDKKAEETLDLITEGAIPSLKMRLGITASRVGGYHPLKLCSDCAGDEQERLGYSYWHIEHQFPSSFVCPKHARPLVFLRDVTSPVHRRYWLTPAGPHDCKLIEMRVPSETAMATLLRLARDSLELTMLPPGYLSPVRAAGGYQRLLRGRGLATTHGNLRIGKLVSLVRERYRGLEGLPGMAPLDSVGDEWPGLAASLSRRSPQPGHPLKHLLLIGAITDSWEEFVQACESGCDSTPVEHQTNPRPAKDRDLTRFKQLVAEGSMSISGASRIVGVSTTTGVQWATRLGIPFISRSKSVTPALVGEIRRLLAKGEPVGTIAMSSGVSSSVVNRILGADERLKALRSRSTFSHRKFVAHTTFSHLCRRYAHLPLSELRKLPGNGYAWLYRNDQPWLTKALRRLGRLPSIGS